MDSHKFLELIEQNKSLTEQKGETKIRTVNKKEIVPKRGLFTIKKGSDNTVQIERDERNFGSRTSLYYCHNVIYQSNVRTPDAVLLFLADTGGGIFKSEDGITANRIAYIDAVDKKLVVNPQYEDDLKIFLEHVMANRTNHTKSEIILVEETKSLGIVQEIEKPLPEIVPERKGIRSIFTKKDRKALASLENM